MLELALPGLAVDLAWGLLPGRLPRLLRGALLGACAGATHLLPVLIAEGLAGVAASDAAPESDRPGGCGI